MIGYPLKKCCLSLSGLPLPYLRVTLVILLGAANWAGILSLIMMLGGEMLRRNWGGGGGGTATVSGGAAVLFLGSSSSLRISFSSLRFNASSNMSPREGAGFLNSHFYLHHQRSGCQIRRRQQQGYCPASLATAEGLMPRLCRLNTVFLLHPPRLQPPLAGIPLYR